VVGFEADKKALDPNSGEILDHVTPSDLIEYGLIPEMVGRLPVAAALRPLDEEAMLSILTKPKNALVKQYARLLELDGVELTFEPAALEAAVKIAIKRGTGARALRSIFERAMLEMLFDVPSRPEIAEVVITRDTITDGKPPKYVTRAEKKAS
jgi:ATP-dependent Clp protease ATP-binding subunit ClpX